MKNMLSGRPYVYCLLLMAFIGGCATKVAKDEPVAVGLLFGPGAAKEEVADPGRRLDAPVVDLSEVQQKATEAVLATQEQETRDGGLLFNQQEVAVWPLEKGRVSSPFGWRKRHFHAGIDIVAPRGSRVMASLGGTVLFAGRVKGYGRLIVLEHNTSRTAYAHLSEILVSKGQKIQRGDLIGRVGSTGRATGPHLHFEYRTLDDEPQNPLLYLPQDNLLSLR